MISLNLLPQVDREARNGTGQHRKFQHMNVAQRINQVEGYSEYSDTRKRVNILRMMLPFEYEGSVYSFTQNASTPFLLNFNHSHFKNYFRIQVVCKMINSDRTEN